MIKKLNAPNSLKSQINNNNKNSSLYGVLNLCGEYGIYGDSRDSHETYDYCESDYFNDSDGFCGSGKSVNLGEVTDSES